MRRRMEMENTLVVFHTGSKVRLCPMFSMDSFAVNVFDLPENALSLIFSSIERFLVIVNMCMLNFVLR